MKEKNKPASDPNAITGLYQANSRGFGFVTPDDAAPGESDYFIPPRCEGDAWNGDRVIVRPDKGYTPPGERRTATITAVVERSSKLVTGCLKKHNREMWLKPDSDRLPRPILVVGGSKGARAGDKVAVSISSYGNTKHPPMGTVKEIFGRDGTRTSSTAAILYQYDIDPDFPAAVLAQADEAPQVVDPAAMTGRLDLRDETIITIDGASAKDLDDAVSLKRDGQGRWELGVHIADVSHYVQAGSPLDLEAWERGTSVYFADQVIPMLPKALSNGICSLNPQVPRLALSCIITMGDDGSVLDHRIAKSVIQTAERMTYDDCNTLLENTDPALAERYAAILPMLRDMAKLAAALEKRRRLRGSLDLDSSESYILCNGEGVPVDIRIRRQGTSEALIESFMLAANECVAEHLFALKKPAVYRVHEKPSADKTEGLRTMLAPLGYELPEADNFTLQKILTTAKEHPKAASPEAARVESSMVSSMVLRSLMKARYDVQNLGHFGLAAKFYCHFTSPIRRYPDLMVHRILSALVTGKLEGKNESKLLSAAQKAASQSSEREIAAQCAEREIEKLYMAEFMAEHVGEVFPAAVSGVTRFGLFLALENGVEGLLPTEALPDDYYHFDEARMTLSGERTGRVYSFGMPLQVICAAADPASGLIDFRLERGADLPPRSVKPSPAGDRDSGGPRRRKSSRSSNPRAMHVPKQKKGRKKR